MVSKMEQFISLRTERGLGNCKLRISFITCDVMYGLGPLISNSVWNMDFKTLSGIMVGDIFNSKEKGP